MKAMILTVALLGLGIGSVPAADLSLDSDFPVAGTGQNVSLTGAEDADHLRLWVVYSPNSETQTEEEIGRFSSQGTISWNPSRSGIATLSARDAAGSLRLLKTMFTCIQHRCFISPIPLAEWSPALLAPPIDT